MTSANAETAGQHAEPPNTTAFAYSAGPAWMLDFALPIFLIFVALAFIVLLVLDMLASRPPWIDLPLLVLWALLGYWSLWRVAYRLEYANGVLMGRGPYSTWRLRGSDIVCLRPARIDIGYEVMETRSDPGKVSISVAKGFALFSRELQKVHPEFTVQLGPATRWLESLPWPSSFKKLEP